MGVLTGVEDRVIGLRIPARAWRGTLCHGSQVLEGAAIAQLAHDGIDEPVAVENPAVGNRGDNRSIPANVS